MMPRLCRLAFRRVLLGLVAAVFIVECVAGPALAQSKDILVFGAASLKNALDEANALYMRQTNRKVVVSYGASSALPGRSKVARRPTFSYLRISTGWTIWRSAI